jgi:hypothetical protein
MQTGESWSGFAMLVATLENQQHCGSAFAVNQTEQMLEQHHPDLQVTVTLCSAVVAECSSLGMN